MGVAASRDGAPALPLAAAAAAEDALAAALEAAAAAAPAPAAAAAVAVWESTPILRISRMSCSARSDLRSSELHGGLLF